MLSEAPIFIVGSPRSGTSILCWCLGQHPNILPLEETNWFSTLALALQLCHLQGTARGYRSQLSSMGITRDQLFQVVGEGIRAMISGQRSAYEAESARIAELEAKPVNRAFLLSRNALDPKRRWVDGTAARRLPSPGVVPTLRHLQDSAHRFDRVLWLMLGDKLIRHLASLE